MQNESIGVQDEIELMDLFKVIWRRKWIIIIIVAVALLGTVYSLNSQKQLRTELGVSLLWGGVEKGIYPDGSIFIGNDIVAPDILNKSKFGSNLTGYIEVQPLIPKHIKEKMNKDSEFVFHPNKFKLILIDDNESIFLSNKEKEEALKDIANTFIEVVTHRFRKTLFSVKFPEGFIENSEYEDVLNVLEKYFTSMTTILTKKNEMLGPFRIDGVDYNFADLLSRLFILRSVEFMNILVEIESHCLAKDKEKLTTRLLRKVSNLESKKIKNQKIVERTFEFLNLLKFGSSSNVRDSVTGRSNIQYEMNSSIVKELKENDYVSYLIKLNLDAETKVVEESWAINDYKKRIEGIKNNGENFAKTDHDIIVRLRALENKLMNLMKDANDLNYKYIESKFGNGMRIDSTINHIVLYQYNPKLLLIVVFLGSLLLSLFIAFLVEYFVGYKKNN